MTTRPNLDSTPEDASIAKWTKDLETFVEDLIGSANLPSAPAQVKVVSQSNSVKVTFRAVNEVGVSEYKIYRGTEKNFAGGDAEHIATVTQAIDPSATDLVYIDSEATEKSYYFVSSVKGIRRPRLEGLVAGFGSATTGHAIGEGAVGGGTISGLSGIRGSILFINEDTFVDQDNENFFYSQTFKAMVVGGAGLMWGPQKSPDIVLIREGSDILSLKRGTNNQTFRIYETVDGTDSRYVEIIGIGASGGAEVMANTALGATNRDLVVGTRDDADLRLFRNNLEQVRISDLSTDLGLNNLAFGSAFGVEDTILLRDGAADTLALKRGLNAQAFRVYEAASTTPLAITQTLLLAEDVQSVLTIFTTSSIAPSPNKLILILVNAVDAGFSGPILVDSITGAGLTWVEVAEVQFDTIAGPRQTTAMYRALGPGATPGALTITMDGPAAVADWIIVEIDNVDIGGVDGADAIVQAVTNVADSGASITATLAAFGGVNNATLGCFATAGAGATVTPGTGFAEIAENSGAGIPTHAMTFRNDNDTTVDASFSLDADNCAIAIELKNAVQLGDTFLELKALGVSNRFEVLVDDAAGTVRELAIGTRALGGDLVVLTGGSEAARFGTDASLDLNNLNVTEGLFFDAGSILAGRGSLWLGVDPANRATTNYSIGGFGDTQTRINADTTVRFFIDDTVEYASYSSISVEWRHRRRVFIEGQIDTEQLIVRGHSTQTADIFVVDRDDLQDLFTVDDLGFVDLPAYDLGNDLPGRCFVIGRNTHSVDEGPAPAIIDLEAADGASLILWSDDEGDLRVGTVKPTGTTGTPSVDANTTGFKLSPLERDHFHFASRIGSFGVEFSAGGYTFSAADANLTQASTTVTIGTANHPYYAHAFLVAAAAGAASGGAGEVEIEVSGTSIDDNGVRTASDTEILVADITAMVTDQYFETAKKWIGTVTWTLQVAGGGTHTTFNADFNYGLAKYEDFGNMDFELTGFELTGRAGAADTGFNVELCEHKATGWTYSAAAFVAGLGTALVDVAALWSTESDLASGELFAFKKLDISSQIAGSGAEGYIIRVTTGANAAVETMNMTVTARLN